MKTESSVSYTFPKRKTHIEPSSSSPNSAFRSLRRKLSPRKEDNHSLSINPNAPKCTQLQRVFRYFDRNGDGKISPAELQSCVRIAGGELSTEEAQAAVQSSDLDGDGLLGFDEFEKLIEVSGEEEKRGDLREAFGMFEMEGSGCITPTSLKRMLSRLGESSTVEDCEAMIRTFDLNGDGVLSFEEFANMMR